MVYHSIWTPHHKHHLHGAALCDRCRTSKNEKQLLHCTFRYLFHTCQQEVDNKVQPTVCRMGSPRAVEREAVQPVPRAPLGRSARHAGLCGAPRQLLLEHSQSSEATSVTSRVSFANINRRSDGDRRIVGLDSFCASHRENITNAKRRKDTGIIFSWP